MGKIKEFFKKIGDWVKDVYNKIKEKISGLYLKFGDYGFMRIEFYIILCLILGTLLGIFWGFVGNMIFFIADNFRLKRKGLLNLKNEIIYLLFGSLIGVLLLLMFLIL